jgi:hypothetical protein
LGLGAGVAESAIESQLGFEALRNALRQQQYQGLFDLLRGERQAESQQTQDSGFRFYDPSTWSESLKDIDVADVAGMVADLRKFPSGFRVGGQ